MGHETATSIQKPQTLKRLHQAIYWTSFPFGILIFVLPIYGKELVATALEIGGFFALIMLENIGLEMKLGRKTPMTAGLLIGALASVLIHHLRSIIGLAVLWAVVCLLRESNIQISSTPAG